jgi:two-component system response regulator AtoC
MPDQILVVEDDDNLAFVLCEALQRRGYRAEAVGTLAAMRERLTAAPYDLVLLDLRLPDGDGLDAIPQCRELAPDTPIIAMTAYTVRRVATEALRRGAYDFFTKPLKISEIEIVVGRALERRRLQQRIATLEASRMTGFEELIGSSQAFVRALEAARRGAPTDLTVLIEGESGTGKELLAQAIHRGSARKGGPLVAVNCAAIPEGLLESELFGHERGAFTGAIRTRVGRFELARGGTLFLDEIGDMPLGMQAKILRAIEERRIERVGGNRPIDVDVRIIAATNQTLGQLVEGGRFRADLPPVRERLDDLPELIDTFLDHAQRKLSRTTTTLSDEALQCLWVHAWPGNVRELKHVLEGAVLLADGVIRPEHLPPAVQTAGVKTLAPSSATTSEQSLDETLDDIERHMILAALGRAGGVQVRAARLLSITEQSLWYRIKKHGIQARATGLPPTGSSQPASSLPAARPTLPVELRASAEEALDRSVTRSRSAGRSLGRNRAFKDLFA